MKKISNYIAIIVLLTLSVVGASLVTQEPGLAAPLDQAQQGATEAIEGGGPTFEETLRVITNILIFIVGIASVIMIVIGAIKYTTSNGDSAQITSAKNTIIYSIVGLILAVMAGAIVNFVLAQF